jgi:hypothetical protein
MNINRNNYESFFLLYVDNELSATERNALELFVQENTDLQEELDMLKLSIVKADDIFFIKKDKLFKPEIIAAEKEEQLLLYIDGELTDAAAKAFEKMVTDDAGLAGQLQLLQQTKLLPADKIIFADKQLLYKKENNRVIPFGRWKLAAAAVFIGVGIWGTAIYFNSTSTVKSIETADSKGIKEIKSVKHSPVVIAPAPVNRNSVVVAPIINKAEKTTQQIITKTTSPVKTQSQISKDNNTAVIDKKVKTQPDNHLPKPYFENINNPERNKNEVAGVTPETPQNKINSVVNTVKENKLQPAASDNNVYTVAFNDTNDEDKQDRFELSEEGHKKSKLSGFLRKAKRVLERNTKMKPGDNNVKVANLEFAIQ